MVCIPCIVIPLFLWIFHRFLQPLIMPYLPENWQRWFNVRMKGYGITKDGETETQEKTTDGSESKEKEQDETEKDHNTSNGSVMKCPFSQNGSAAKEIAAGGDKKTD